MRGCSHCGGAAIAPGGGLCQPPRSAAMRRIGMDARSRSAAAEAAAPPRAKPSNSAARVEGCAPAVGIDRVAGINLATGITGFLPRRAEEEAALAAAITGLERRILLAIDLAGMCDIAEGLRKRVALGQVRQVFTRSGRSAWTQADYSGGCGNGSGSEESTTRRISTILRIRHSTPP